MFLPSLMEIIVIFLIAIIFFKMEDWVKIFQKWKNFKSFINKFFLNSKEILQKEIQDIEKEIIKSEILNKIQADDPKLNAEKKTPNHEEIFIINNKKYIYGEDKKIHEIFDIDLNNK